MEPVYVVCQGKGAAAVLTELFRPAFKAAQVKVVAANERYDAIGLARTRAALGPASAVALVLNADMTNELRVRGDQKDIQWMLRTGAGGRPCETFLFMPEVEVVLFRSPAQLTGALGLGKLTEANLVGGRYAPREEIVALLKKAGRTYDTKEATRVARAVGADAMLQNAQAAELHAFVARQFARTPAASVA